MLNGLFVLVVFQVFLKIASYVYRRKINKSFSYKVPTKGLFNNLVDRNKVYNDDVVTKNEDLAKEINYLFYGELVGVFLMIIGAIYFLLM